MVSHLVGLVKSLYDDSRSPEIAECRWGCGCDVEVFWGGVNDESREGKVAARLVSGEVRRYSRYKGGAKLARFFRHGTLGT